MKYHLQQQLLEACILATKLYVGTQKENTFWKRDQYIIDLTQIELINIALEKIFQTIKNNSKVFISLKNKHPKQYLN